MAEFYQVKRRKLFHFNLTFWLIVINVLISLVVLIVNAFYPRVLEFLALTPALVVKGKFLWTLITSIFVHANFPHLFFNMISLFFLGSLVEKILGRKRFLWFYLVAGVLAGIFFALLSGFLGFGVGEKIFGNPLVSGVGASGAIFGLVGILAVLIPHKRIYLIAGPLLAIIVQSVLGTLFPQSAFMPILDTLLTLYFFVSIFAVFSFNPFLRKVALPLEIPFWCIPFIAIIPLIIIGFLNVALPIGNMAHLGGFVVGMVYGFYLRNKYKNKTRYISRYFS